MTSDRALCSWCVLSHLGSTLATVSDLAEDGILQAALFAEEAASQLGISSLCMRSEFGRQSTTVRIMCQKAASNTFAFNVYTQCAYRYDSITIMYIHYTYYVEKTRCIKGKHVVSILSRYKGKTRCSYKQDSMFLWDNKMKALQPSIFKHCAHTFWHMTMLAQSVYRHFQKGGIPKSSQVIY